MTQLAFEPEKWHACEEDTRRSCTKGVNCYAYALNRPDYYWAVPGMGFAHKDYESYRLSYNTIFEDMPLGVFRQTLIDGAINDGLIPVEEPAPKDGHYLVALFFTEDRNNFHWYRQDNNGLWSHKCGWRAATDRDENGDQIHDPRDMPHSDYTEFGRFFLIPYSGIVLTERFPLTE